MATDRSAGVSTEGLARTVRALQNAGVDAADLKEVMATIGRLVVTTAIPLAPERSGALAGSIRAGGGKTKAVVRAGGARVPYAGVIHYGGYHGIEAHPFLTEAVEKERGPAVAKLDEGIDAILKKNDLK